MDQANQFKLNSIMSWHRSGFSWIVSKEEQNDFLISTISSDFCDFPVISDDSILEISSYPLDVS
jgi:hypothetical protein